MVSRQHQQQRPLPLLSSLPHTPRRGLTDLISQSPAARSEPTLPEDKRLVKRTLPNGLQVYLLPSKKFKTFAAFLEILAGSADESDLQRGMAHLVEHLVCCRMPEMKSNALVDFHHSVFFHFDCQPSSLPRVCDSLSNILSDPPALYSPERLEAEKKLCLSEMAMIDTLRARIDSQTFSSLHSENLLPHRAPIGDRDQILSWTPSHLREFYRSHYLPHNSKLYLCGNFEPNIAEALISERFGAISASSPASSSSPASRGVTLKSLNRHFPPVVHRWTGEAKTIASDLSKYRHLSESDKSPRITNEMIRDLSQTQSTPSVKVIPTPSREEVTIHLFAKQPLLPQSSLSDLQRDLVRRVLQRILQIRSYCPTL